MDADVVGFLIDTEKTLDLTNFLRWAVLGEIYKEYL